MNPIYFILGSLIGLFVGHFIISIEEKKRSNEFYRLAKKNREMSISIGNPKNIKIPTVN